MLPHLLMRLLVPFKSLFCYPTWVKVQILFIGAILAIGKRTVTASLRVMGLENESHFANYHHLLSRAIWSPYQGAQRLLTLLLNSLSDEGEPLVFGIDETIERRRGTKISARGIYRDSVRSSASHFVKTSGLRWICLMWLTNIPWTRRIWALPFFTVLAPSQRYYEGKVRSHKKLTDWARQMIFQLRRWLPTRYLVVVADYSYAVLELLAAVGKLANPVTLITRLRFDAALYEPAPVYSGRGRPRKKGRRLPTLQALLYDCKTKWRPVTLNWYGSQTRVMEITSQTAVWYHSGKPPVPIRWVLIRDPLARYDPVALLSTDLTLCPVQIVNWFVSRWQMEVTFEEVRAHLGVETQRQWSEKAIARTTPILMGLFSWITLAANLIRQQNQVSPRQAAWYFKSAATFSDALAWVRQLLWSSELTFSHVDSGAERFQIPPAVVEQLISTVCYAA